MQGERKRSAGGVHGDSRVWPMDSGPGGDPRTPLAWQHRNLNYQQQQQHAQQHSQQHAQQHAKQHAQQQLQQQHHAMQQQGYLERLASPGHAPQHSPKHVGQVASYNTEDSNVQTSRGRRPSSPSTATSATSSSSSTSRSQKQDYSTATLPMYAAMPGHGHMVHPTSTWDGEPCPVHHLHAINAIMAPPPPPPAAMILSPMTTMSRRGTPSYPPSLPAPPTDKGIMMLLPPMMRPRPLVLPAENASHPEPLPVRDPKSINTISSPNRKDSISLKDFDANVCEGHTIVLWFIITIITIGVILAAVLRFVMG